LSFCQENLYQLLVEAYRKTKHYDVKKSELVLEIDFCDKATGLHGEFKIGLTKNYFDGNRPDEPDWFYKKEEVYERNIQGWVMGLRDHYRRVIKYHRLVTCRYADSHSGSSRVHPLVEPGHQSSAMKP
jgi:hypothetical protein